MVRDDPLAIPERVKNWSQQLLLATIIVTALAATAGVIAMVLLWANPVRFANAVFVAGIAGAIAGGAAAVGLLVIAMLLHRRVEDLAEEITTIDQQTAIMAEQSVARTQAHTFAQNSQGAGAEVRDLLTKLYEATLLPDDERAKRYEKLAEHELAERTVTVREAIDSYDFHHAREEIASLVERFGADDRIVALENHLQQVTERARAKDIDRATRLVRALIKDARWDEAEQAAKELGKKYPDTRACEELIQKVHELHEQFKREHRMRMHGEIQQFANQRRWSDALEAARRYIELFPSGADTEAIRAQIGTLEANAEIQVRQSLERRIKQFMSKQQYWDALALARRIITEYPLSPQANVLRTQLRRLEELARTQVPPAPENGQQVSS